MSSFPPTLWLAAPQGMHGHPGLCSCARSGVAPRVLEGLVPLGRCKGDEVFRVATAVRNTLWELCALWKAKTPLKSIGTCCRTVRPAVALGWPRGCCGRRVRGAQRVPHAPGLPVGEQSGWWQHPKARVQRNSLGTAQDVGLEVLGLGQQGLQQSESAGVRGHACTSLLTCVQVCMALSFPWSLLWSGKDSGC